MYIATPRYDDCSLCRHTSVAINPGKIEHILDQPLKQLPRVLICPILLTATLLLVPETPTLKPDQDCLRGLQSHL